MASRGCRDAERPRLERITRLAAPEPDQQAGDARRRQGLRRVGERHVAAPHAHPGEHALDLVPADVALLEHHLARERRRRKGGTPYLGSERQRGETASAARVAAAAAQARQRPVATSTSGIISPNCGL